jgi:membrane protein
MFARSKDFLQQVFADFAADDCSSMAAALAFWALFSLPSLLLIIIYVAGLALGPEAASGQIQARLSSAMGPSAASEIQGAVSNIAHSPRNGIIASVFGIAGLMVSALSVLLQLQASLNRAWRVRLKGSGVHNYIMARVRSVLLMIGGGILVMVSLTVTSALTAAAQQVPYEAAVHLCTFIISMLALAVVFGAILKAIPDVNLEWRDVWVGGLFIAALFEIGKFLIALYLGHLGKTSVYGAAGSLAAFLLWTYYSALVFLLGVEFTQVWIRFQGGKVQPKEGAVLIEGGRPAIRASAAAQ